MPTLMPTAVEILTDQPIPTWFNLGGRAARMAKPRTVEELQACLHIDPNLRVLGDGANLLVADQGVPELVVSLRQGTFDEFTIGAPDPRGGVTVSAGAGVHLFKLINATTDSGLTGLETLAGIPACIGGAAVMNAGGKYGSIGDVISTVRALDRSGNIVTLKRTSLEFTYRHSSLMSAGLIVTGVDLRLRRTDHTALKARLKEITEFKKSTQPLAANSAGCCFKNPTLTEDLRDLGTIGTRVSAGMLIDKAGCKGLSVGAATVSNQHANFIVAGPGCTAANVIDLMRQVRDKVKAKFGITIEPEVVFWGATF